VSSIFFAEVADSEESEEEEDVEKLHNERGINKRDAKAATKEFE
jgi:hypothetical protein